MRRLAPLVATAALAVATVLPATAAAADPACVTAGYSVLGSGNDFGTCVPTPYPAHSVSTSSGTPELVQVRLSVDVPLP